MGLGEEILGGVGSGINNVFYSNVTIRSCRSSNRHGLPVESLHIVKLHDSIVVFSPPPLRLPLVEQLSTAMNDKKKVTKSNQDGTGRDSENRTGQERVENNLFIIYC